MKVRTIASAKSGSQRCRAAALSGRWIGNFWKRQEMKSIRYSGLAQSHAPLPTTTRALTWTPSTEKMHGQIQFKNQSSKLIYRAEALSSYILPGQGERRNKTQIYQARGGREWGREGTRDVSATSENTYNSSNKVRESNIPGGSSVRSLKLRSLKSKRDEIDQIVSVGSISRPIAHHY